MGIRRAAAGRGARARIAVALPRRSAAVTDGGAPAPESSEDDAQHIFAKAVEAALYKATQPAAGRPAPQLPACWARPSGAARRSSRMLFICLLGVTPTRMWFFIQAAISQMGSMPWRAWMVNMLQSGHRMSLRTDKCPKLRLGVNSIPALLQCRAQVMLAADAEPAARGAQAGQRAHPPPLRLHPAGPRTPRATCAPFHANILIRPSCTEPCHTDPTLHCRLTDSPMHLSDRILPGVTAC